MNIILEKKQESVLVTRLLEYHGATNTIKAPEDFLLKDIRSNEFQKDIFPPGLLYISPNKKSIIFQQPPEWKVINYNFYEDDVDEEYEEVYDSRKFNIFLPWVIYMAEFDMNNYISDIHIFFSRSQIVHSMERLHAFPLPNVFKESNVCRSYASSSVADNGLVSEMIQVAYDAVWGSNFNKDTFGSFANCLDDTSFCRSFGLYSEQHLKDYISNIRRGNNEGHGYPTYQAEELMINFLESYEKKSESFILEAADWAFARWGDYRGPNVHNLIHYLKTSSMAFDSTALKHKIWVESSKHGSMVTVA